MVKSSKKKDGNKREKFIKLRRRNRSIGSFPGGCPAPLAFSLAAACVSRNGDELRWRPGLAPTLVSDFLEQRRSMGQRLNIAVITDASVPLVWKEMRPRATPAAATVPKEASSSRRAIRRRVAPPSPSHRRTESTWNAIEVFQNVAAAAPPSDRSVRRRKAPCLICGSAGAKPTSSRSVDSDAIDSMNGAGRDPRWRRPFLSALLLFPMQLSEPK